MSGIDNATRLATALQAGLAIPDDVRHWLQDGLTAYLRDGLPLEAGLGLKTHPGQLRPHTVARLEARNRTLRALGHWAAPGMRPGPAARRVMELVWRYRRGEPLDPPATLLLDKLEGAAPPGSLKQLARILAD